MSQKLLSIIIPVFNEESVLPLTNNALHAILDDSNYQYELIYVNDGSNDHSLSLLKSFTENHLNTRYLSFARNFGHQVAITAGMNIAKGDAIIIIDADLQDPPEVIIEMAKKWEDGYDVVYAKRKERHGETVFKKISANIYYRLLWSISDVRIPVDTGDFRLIDKKVNDILSTINEKNRYVRGLVSWVGFNQCECEYVRHERVSGETKYSIKKMIKLALDGMTSMSKYPLKLGLVIGTLLLTVGLIMLITNIFSPFTRFMDIFFILLSGMLFFYLGITGMYLGRIYDESLNRPLYIIDEENSYYE